jgi:hypothetical protein
MVVDVSGGLVIGAEQTMRRKKNQVRNQKTKK